MRQFDNEAAYTNDDSVCMVFEEKEEFHNALAKEKGPHKLEPSKIKEPPPRTGRRDALPTQSMPKMQFPKFDGTKPKIWKDNCKSYFELYHLPEGMWITAATLHVESNAAMWYQSYKQNHTFANWAAFCSVVD